MSSFFWLLFAHLLADYPLQGEFLATMKGKNNIILATHAGIWTGMICLAMSLLGISFTALDVVLLFTVHTIADYLKAKNIWFYKKLNPLSSGLLVDQSIHVLQILAVLYV
jgi:Protein of unknown function (DUF3307)